ncbi:fibronectin type III domain-containing protein [Anaeromyxobacter sp. SG26]|uniref:fibronectin type III domain-containing protein n=1 Tax=Anaeromyxobacter sp. SG26 TaxID=2925407 RepID=UPI001F59B810|nr:fibronectin type III domain-containing protein [Anaeromyxobacter sp. SG26]
MRRALLLAALALPALVRAQTAGTVTFTPDNLLGSADCDPASTTTVSLSWAVTATGVAGGTYRVYASSRAPTSTTTNAVKLCDTSDVPADSVRAAQIGDDISATANPQSADFRTADFVLATGYSCAETTARTIYVCVHFIPSGQTDASASATGSMKLDLKAPASPANVTVEPGEQGLRVSWDHGTGGAADASYFKIHAVATDATKDARDHWSGKILDETGRLSGRIDGLTNLVEYQVTVIAYSSADNASQPSDPPKLGTPQPVEDFWEYYHSSGGQEQGGCASGPAGALGILGAALALAFRRRK